jgi:hypothetical protein
MAYSVTDYRYSINGTIDTSKDVMTNLESLCSAAGSWFTYDCHYGHWAITINKAETSIASFNDSNIIGAVMITGTGLVDLYNEVNAKFPHIDLSGQADFVDITIPDTDRNTNEPDNTLNLTYDIVNDPLQVELLSLQELKQSRVDQVIKFTTDYTQIGLKAGDVIDVTSAIYGYVNKMFRIITISEVDADNGAINLDITALEYDANVYDASDLTRYDVITNSGITTMGNIGIPGTPVVSVISNVARPHITVTSTAPDGIVEGMEFWYSSDSTTYNLMATVMPSAGNTFAYGDQVYLDYNNINSGNFTIKSRGINKTTSGPFSAPGGFQYYPVQVTNAIGPNTQVVDSNGMMLALGAVSLLNSLYGLVTGNAAGTLWGTISSLFGEKTGKNIDELGDFIANLEATSGNTVTTVTATTQAINNGISTYKSFGDVTIDFNANNTPWQGAHRYVSSSEPTGTFNSGDVWFKI